MLLELLEPFKKATLLLEASEHPCVHKAGRILVSLLYSNKVLQPVDGSTRLQLRSAFAEAAKAKLANFLDDPYYLLEYGVGQFFDPRKRNLRSF